MPANAVTGTRYRGINRVALAAAGAALDTPDGRWLTYSQGRQAGWPVRKGEHSPASVEYWSRWCRTHDDKIVTERRARQLVADGVEDEGILKSARLAPVVTPAFSSAQVEGIPAIPLADHSRAADAIERRLPAGTLVGNGEKTMDDRRGIEALAVRAHDDMERDARRRHGEAERERRVREERARSDARRRQGEARRRAQGQAGPSGPRVPIR